VRAAQKRLGRPGFALKICRLTDGGCWPAVREAINADGRFQQHPKGLIELISPRDFGGRRQVALQRPGDGLPSQEGNSRYRIVNDRPNEALAKRQGIQIERFSEQRTNADVLLTDVLFILVDGKKNRDSGGEKLKILADLVGCPLLQ